MNNLSYRSAGKTSIISGIFGILAFGILWAGLLMRGGTSADHSGDIMFRTHDAGVILQYLFMIHVVFAMYAISQRQSVQMNKTILYIGIGALMFTILFLLLGSFKILMDTDYMIPQGVFGLWLIVVCKNKSVVFPRGLRRLGRIVGVGLILVGTFPIAFNIFVDPIGFVGTLPDNYVDKDTPANSMVHLILLIGSFMGVAILPIWSILLGRKFLRSDSSTNG